MPSSAISVYLNQNNIWFNQISMSAESFELQLLNCSNLTHWTLSSHNPLSHNLSLLAY